MENESLTSSDEIPKSIADHFDCFLRHKKEPYMTGKRGWNKLLHEWENEIVYICKTCHKDE